VKLLLEEGAKSYLDAVTAIIAFQQEVQKKCREVLAANLEDYAAALKVTASLTPDQIVDLTWPPITKQDWTGDKWDLGVELGRKKVIPDVRWWAIRCCLTYEVGEGGLYCWVGEWFQTQKLAEHAHAKFRSLNKNVALHRKEVWLDAALTIQDMASFDDRLDALFQQWIELWKQAGGMNEVFKER
jgi:hypothetical protein